MEELVFKYLELRPDIEHPIKALQRGRDGALILVRNANAQWVLASKAKYVQGLYRMLGGGIEDGEHPAEAAQRELVEETGAEVDIERLVPLVHAEVFYDKDGKSYNFSTFIFYCQVTRELRAGDDVRELMFLSDHDFLALLNRMAELPDTVIPANEPETWADYGKVWGPIHEAAFERVKELGL